MERSIQNILLAEDNNDHYVNFVQAVNSISNQINVMRVDNGYSLLSMLETQINPDVIFLDIDMPYKGGLQILEELQERDRFKNTPIVVLSGSAFDLMIKIAYDLGAILFIRKYNRPEDLQACLKNVFKNPYFLSCTQPPWEEFMIE